MKFKEALIVFSCLFLVMFIIDYFFINRRKLKIIEGKTKRGRKKKQKVIGEIDNLLVPKFKLDKAKINYRHAIGVVAIINSFIISLVSTIIMFINLDMIWILLVAFCLLFGIIYALYEHYGRYLNRKGGR